MADGPEYEVPLRRRRESRTNYKKRLALLKSGDYRAIIRISNKHAQVQLAAYNPEGDEMVASAVSDQLEKYGWDENTGNLPAAYLTGLLAGYRAQENGVTSAVPDLGVRDRQYSGRYYAALQGLRDAGLDIDVEDKVLPSDDRVEGLHAAEYESGNITDTFENVKDTIIEEHGE